MMILISGAGLARAMTRRPPSASIRLRARARPIPWPAASGPRRAKAASGSAKPGPSSLTSTTTPPPVPGAAVTVTRPAPSACALVHPGRRRAWWRATGEIGASATPGRACTSRRRSSTGEALVPLGVELVERGAESLWRARPGRRGPGPGAPRWWPRAGRRDVGPRRSDRRGRLRRSRRPPRRSTRGRGAGASGVCGAGGRRPR